MILAISRFRAANGMEEEVRAAFADRPRRVERAVGYLGMEVFTAVDDPAVFHLVTRWTDAASYEAWHGSEEHQASHGFLPEGLKVVGEETEIRELVRIDDEPGEMAELERLAADGAPLLASLLHRSECLHVVHGASGDGAILKVNGAMARSLGLEPQALVGRSLFEFLTAAGATELRSQLSSGLRLREHVPVRRQLRGARQSAVPGGPAG